MSMEITVFSDVGLDSIAAWQRAIDAHDFALVLDTQATFESMRGFLPATARGKVTGFECFHDNAQELANSYDDPALRRDWKHALSFRWGGSFDECLAAWMAATAYATATKGVVFDTQESKVFSPEGALAVVREIERERPAYELMLRDAINRFKAGT
jgi:hypothetical protein